LAEAAKEVREIQQKNVQDIGREFFIPEEEDGIVEEAIREYEAATQQESDSTFMLLNTVDQTLNKKKELTNHQNQSGQGHEYAPFQKNIYRVAKSVASLTPTEITNRRAKLKIRVRGVQVPAPVLQFHEMGLPESVLQYMTQHHHPPITTPYPIQAQCIPCILAGRDVIGIAKTGSGKTLAYVLPMLRHIIIQPPLGGVGGSNANKPTSSVLGHRSETGPIALILVPARELAFQIHSVCKPYAKLLGLK
jgi:ATP-dependent RNA helicase DDX46/PRP5